MNDSDCSLNYYQFSLANSSYLPMNRKVTPNNTNACSYLQVMDRSIVTNTSAIFLQLSSSNLSRAYFIIDDNAILRFIGILNPSESPSDVLQTIINTNLQSNKYVFLLDSHVQIADRLKTVTNERNWIFQATAQTLTITNIISQFSQTFSLPNAFFDLNGIYDIDNETFPGVIFSGAKLAAVCGGEKNRFYGPFIL